MDIRQLIFIWILINYIPNTYFMSNTSTNFQLMPEFTKGFLPVAVLFFNHDTILLLVLIWTHTSVRYSKCAHILYLHLFNLLDFLINWGSSPSVADGWAPSCGTPSPFHGLCQRSSGSANLCVLNRAEDFFPHTSASSPSLALDAVSRCRR